MRKPTCYEWLVLSLSVAFILYCAGWLLFRTPTLSGWQIDTDRTADSAPPTAQSTPAYPESLLPGEIINLNTASRSDLLRLPSIGATKADAILAYRQEHGPFQSTQELLNVFGIGPATLETLRPYVSVE